MPLVEQDLLTLSEHMNSLPVFSGVRVTRSLVLCVRFVYRCLSFSFGHCVVCSSIDGFWLPLWYKTLLGIFKLFLSGELVWFKVIGIIKRYLRNKTVTFWSLHQWVSVISVNKNTNIKSNVSKEYIKVTREYILLKPW